MDLWQANSNARPLSETIDKHAKAFKVVNWQICGQGSDRKEAFVAQCASYNFEAKERETDFPLVLAVYECITQSLNNHNRFSDCKA